MKMVITNRYPHLLFDVARCSLIILWCYAALSKLLEYDTARSEMLNQPFPLWMSEILAWGVPAVELSIASLLLFTKTRLKGLIASLVLLCSFTIYIVLVKLNYFGYVPCSCGGIISRLSWEGHFIFNMVFITLAGIALILKTEDSLKTRIT